MTLPYSPLRLLVVSPQILDAFMSTTAPCPSLTEWQQSFITHGGIQSLAGALHDITQLARQLPTTTSAANFGAARYGP